jgi:exopolyphosphatase/guanosine-5'-triphosphate,3'-diphosphate pyrophosphatase
MPWVYATADIGSNTAHLLVAATDGSLVMRIDNVNEWIPLGEEVARHSRIPQARVEEMVSALKEFRRVSSSKSAHSLYVFGTEAMRRADNHLEVLERIRNETGVTVELIPPRREAELSFRGVQLDTSISSPNLLFEVGGGSVQVALLGNGEIQEEISLPLGTGRVIAEAGLTNPCTPGALVAAQAFIDSQLSKINWTVAEPRAVASGGVGRGLWRALHPDGEKILALAEVEYLAWSAARLPTARITERFGVKTKRAGTLLPGALVYSSLLRKFGADNLMISEFGVREGAILEMADGHVRGMLL